MGKTKTHSEELSEILSQLDSGTFLPDFVRGLKELVRQVEMTKKTGSIGMKLTVRPNNRMIEIVPDLSVTFPKALRTNSFYFADMDGSLSRKDPLQPSLDGVTGVEEE